MKRWALLVVVLYMLLLAALALPLLVVAFAENVENDVKELMSALHTPGQERIVFCVSVWSWVGVMGLAQVGLLVVPVRIAGGRRVTRRWIIWPILAALVLMGVMVAAMYLGVWETLEHTPDDQSWQWTAAYCAAAGAWLVWAFLFGFYSGNRPPKTFMSRLVKFLVAGSILELLVAVPTHVLARVRAYCCAGFGTFWGLAAGLSVMIAAFGPGVFFLFVRRWGSLKPSLGTKEETPTTPNDKSPADPD